MRKTLFICSILLAGAASAAPGGDIDYTAGVFIVNEDWYGHQNSTVNYLMPDAADGNYWHYRVVQTENPGMELGCTNQYGAIWNGRFYFIAKQDKDPGSAVQGGRITVADASTMKILHQSALIDPSGTPCDGRGFIGVDERKGYISTSNGVWIIDLDTYEVTGQVEGTENSTPSNLYSGQCGTMVSAGGRIFVAHQQLGLLVIDTEQDNVTDIVPMTCVSEKAGIGSVVKSKDGSLWVSVAKSTGGQGQALPYIVKVDPETLATENVAVPDGMFPPSNSWYAWTPDSFCASSVTNSLYWSGGSNSWFSGQNIFRYDIDSKTLSKIIDLKADGENWKLYGCSMRLHPATDEIYMSLYHEFSNPTYITRRYTSSGEKIRDYDMISNYWFPSIPVFPEKAFSGIKDLNMTEDSGEITVANINGIIVFKGTRSTFETDIRPTLTGGIYLLRAGNSVKKIAIGK